MRRITETFESLNLRGVDERSFQAHPASRCRDGKPVRFAEVVPLKGTWPGTLELPDNGESSAAIDVFLSQKRVGTPWPRQNWWQFSGVIVSMEISPMAQPKERRIRASTEETAPNERFKAT